MDIKKSEHFPEAKIPASRLAKGEASKLMIDTRETELENRLQQAFGKCIRIAAENEDGQFSARWIFWGNRSDYYFGAKSLSGAFKVSLHANGVGYVAYDKNFLAERRAAGIDIAAKTTFEWKLPVPQEKSAVHAAMLILPADYCRNEPLTQEERKKTLVLGVRKGCAAQVGIFISRESGKALEERLCKIGQPLFTTVLENGLSVHLIARSHPFDPKALPTAGQTEKAKSVLLKKPEDINEHHEYNAMLWNDPGDGGVLQVIDIGGVRMQRNKKLSAT